MITSHQKELIKSTVPVLREHGVLLTTHFYKRMFSNNPELKNIFNMGNQQNGKQQTSLALAVLAYAENVNDPTVLKNALIKIGHKHKSLDIRPEHYSIVGKHLIASIAEVLGSAASLELLEAWKVAYDQLASLMIEVEADLYKQDVAEQGGWTGWRPFIVKKKAKESEEITSFYLYPADGGKVSDFLPGQYLSVRLFLPELNLFQPRQYSLSNAPNGNFYRISVKREPEFNTKPEGMVSNRLHTAVEEGSIVELSAPAGDFVLTEEKETPIVFISGGVGQTPLISMLEHLLDKKSKRNIMWVHGCRNYSVHAFKNIFAALPTDTVVESNIFYEKAENLLSNEGCYEGIVDLKRISGIKNLKNADFYICGPAPFIQKQFKDLTMLGFNKEVIFFEEFGPNTLVLN